MYNHLFITRMLFKCLFKKKLEINDSSKLMSFIIYNKMRFDI